MKALSDKAMTPPSPLQKEGGGGFRLRSDSPLTTAMQNCRAIFEEIEAALRLVEEGGGSSFQLSFALRYRWPLHKGRLREMLVDLEKTKTTLMIGLLVTDMVDRRAGKRYAVVRKKRALEVEPGFLPSSRPLMNVRSRLINPTGRAAAATPDGKSIHGDKADTAAILHLYEMQKKEEMSHGHLSGTSNVVNWTQSRKGAAVMGKQITSEEHPIQSRSPPSVPTPQRGSHESNARNPS